MNHRSAAVRQVLLGRSFGPEFDGSDAQRRLYKRWVADKDGALHSVLDMIPEEHMRETSKPGRFVTLMSLVLSNRPRSYQRQAFPYAANLELKHPKVEVVGIMTDQSRLIIDGLTIANRSYTRWSDVGFTDTAPYVTAAEGRRGPDSINVVDREVTAEYLDNLLQLSEAMANGRMINLPVATNTPDSVQ